MTIYNFPHTEAILNLWPVTQLYVSIDAATPASLKAVDRPLFADYWERFIDSLKALRKKKQRTTYVSFSLSFFLSTLSRLSLLFLFPDVAPHPPPSTRTRAHAHTRTRTHVTHRYRMTLVKAWNMEELDDYAKLIKLGKPSLIEIKAVTFCGTSDASSLTMKNVPWHREVRRVFARCRALSALLSPLPLPRRRSVRMRCECVHALTAPLPPSSSPTDDLSLSLSLSLSLRLTPLPHWCAGRRLRAGAVQPPDSEGRVRVRQRILITVTFCANPSNDLTCPPHTF